MFEFQAHRNDPAKLLATLERFTKWWFYRFDRVEDDYGVSAERLSKVSLPTPLRHLYGFAGEWPGGVFESVFSHADHLIPFECLSVCDGKLIFVFENQGVWKCGTLVEGDDPPVWIKTNDGDWRPLCDSLAQFLVTFCLHELTFGTEARNRIENAEEAVRTCNLFEVPLWLDGPYASCDGLEKLSFYVIQGQILRMNDWLAGPTGIEKTFPDLFPSASPKTPPRIPRESKWQVPGIPIDFKRDQLKRLARKHDERAEYHTKKSAFYREVLEGLDQDG